MRTGSGKPQHGLPLRHWGRQRKPGSAWPGAQWHGLRGPCRHLAIGKPPGALALLNARLPEDRAIERVAPHASSVSVAFVFLLPALA